MKVKDLIKQLKKMPQNLTVHFAHHDNAEYETAGDVCSVDHCIKEDLIEDVEEMGMSLDEKEFESKPEEWVCIRG